MANRVDSSARRFSHVLAQDALDADRLTGCPVVTATGIEIGVVDAFLCDQKTHRTRFAVVRGNSAQKASVMIPWQALYYDPTPGRLVFYTCR